MFTKQAEAIDAMYGDVDDRVLDVLRFLLGNCQAALVHRGPVQIEAARDTGAIDAMLTVSNYPQPPEDNNTLDPGNGKALWVKNGLALFNGPVAGVRLWGQANANWVNAAGNGANVECKLVDGRSGSEILPERTITVYLVRYGNEDPAVYTNDIIPFFLEADGSAVCESACNGVLADSLWFLSYCPPLHLSSLPDYVS